jgi:acyl-CoA thioesterase
MTPAQIVDTMMSKDAFSQWLGIEVLNIEAGTCTLKMTLRAEMLNGFGIAHGAITYALADSALAFASNSHGRQALSVDTSINHIEAVREGDTIIAMAKEESLKNRFGVYTIQILKDETLVAHFKGTVYRTEKEWQIQS